MVCLYAGFCYLEYHSQHYGKVVWGVLRPSEVQLQSFKENDTSVWFSRLQQRSEDLPILLSLVEGTLVVEPKKVDCSVPNPWLRTTIQLSNADPYVFGRIKKGFPRYGLLVFLCSSAALCD